MTENDPLKIDTDQERDVAVVEVAARNWWKISILLGVAGIIIICLGLIAISKPGSDLLKSIFGKQPIIVQPNNTGVTK